MDRKLPMVLMLVFGLTLSLGAGLFAQIKKDAQSGQDRLECLIISIDMAKSTMRVREMGTTAGFYQISFDDKTEITLLNKAAKKEALKEGLRVIVLGKYEKNVLNATRIEIRGEK